MAEQLSVNHLSLDMTKQQVRLGNAPLGFRGEVEAIEPHDTRSGISPLELESRLIELGFLEGASIEVLHEGLFGRDPIAIRINDTTVALRRREAMAILVSEQEPHI